jgi:Tol biopolymer transport system component
MADMTVFEILEQRVRRTGHYKIHKILCFIWFAVMCGFFAAGAEALTSKEGILFQRNGNLWIMDSDGTHQRQLTKNLVGHVSASRDGRVVFDRFDPIRGLADRNIYYMASVRDGAIRRLTNDNESITPAISPDGRTVAYQQFQWAGKSTWEGSGKGIWAMDLATGRQEELVGVVPVPPDIKARRDALFARAQGGSLDETKWRYDGDLLWSPDSQHLVFSRTYAHGGMVTFRVPVGDRRQVVALPDTFGPRVLDQRGMETLHFDNGSFSLASYDVRTGRSSRLADKVFVYQAKYSPDGTKIATLVTDQRANLPSLWILQTSGTDRRAISVSARAGDLSWSPDGRRILFARYVADTTDMWIVNTDGSHLKKVADNASSPIWIALDMRDHATSKDAAHAPSRPLSPQTSEERQARDRGGVTPPRVYVDEGACPFECCVYRKWTIEQTTTLFAEKDHASRVIATLHPFQVVQARTGVVYTRPAKLEVVWDHGPFRKGEVVYVLTYKGEGFFKVWRNGAIVSSDVFFPTDPPCQGPSAACWGILDGRSESTWWVEIETPTGQVGWTDQPDHFGNKDACG